MKGNWILSPNRNLTEEEKSLVWQKPITHIESDIERRICNEIKRNWNRGEMKITNILLEGDAGSGKTQIAKALSANFRLPYTKVTCFADMDKSDILGAILPVIEEDDESRGVEYQYYPSEIIRAYENGWLLEIQEPTVIRDAAVLMTLNSALELDGSINLPTRVVHRHPDFVVVITTNRGYNGCRPLNEALRDRVQHSEKMDLPSIDTMVERVKAKTGCADEEMLILFANTIRLLDKTAKANAIKGVAGMRSYFYWVDAVYNGEDVIESLYSKVIYKITTDIDEIEILKEAMNNKKILKELKNISEYIENNNGEVMEIYTEEDMEVELSKPKSNNIPAFLLKKSEDSKGHSTNVNKENSLETQGTDTGENDSVFYHEISESKEQDLRDREQKFRRNLNKECREIIKDSIHNKVKMIVHRPEATKEYKEEYSKIEAELLPIIEELVRRTKPLLEHEISTDIDKSKVYGSKFHAEKVSSPDYRFFSKKSLPEEEPSLVVALRIDESASMSAFGRLEAAKKAVVAVYEFCERCKVPLLIYGDTADRSIKEQMSLYSYIDFNEPLLNNKYCLMGIRGRSNNRDGMSLRILSEKLMNTPQKTKLLISISDGQPKAMPDYTGDVAITDMKNVIKEFRRRGITFLATAIGQDKETICNIYGEECFMDITSLDKFPSQLVQIVSRYL